MPITGSRTAHSGHTDVCFDDTGKLILSCGDDGEVRVFNGIDDCSALTYSISDDREEGFAICSRGKKFFVGSAGNKVQSYNLENGEEEAVVATFDAEATCMAASSDGSLIAAGSANCNIRVLTFDAESSLLISSHNFVGHQAPILSVALDPKGKFLASSACDGSVKIWDLESYACLKTLDNVLPKCNAFLSAVVLGRMSFLPKSGAFLAVPFPKEVKLFNREKWEAVGTLADSSVNAALSISIFSPDGSHLAAAHNNGTIVLYNVASRQTVKVVPSANQNRIRGMQWSPVVEAASLAYSDDHGHVTLIEKAYTVTAEKTFDGSVNSQVKKNIPAETATTDVQSVVKRAPPTSLAESVYSDGDDSNLANGDETPVRSPDEMEMDLEMEIGSEFEIKKRNFPKFAPETSRSKAQEAFQPGATPSFLQSSFMVWNEIGYMNMYQQEEEGQRAIDVIYHNSAFHHSIHLFNTDNFTLGALNAKGFLLATERPRAKSTEEKKSSKIHFTLVGASDKWTLDLDAGEWVEGLALGDEWCYVATSRRLLRVITFSGYQQYIIDFCGPLVAVAARQRLFMIAYHQADPTLNGDQCIGFSMYCMGKRQVEVVVASERLPLSPKSEMSWFGFGARGTPTLADSSGMVRLYHYRSPLCKIWSPCLDMAAKSKIKQDRYFMFALDEDTRQVKAFLCRNSRYPVTLPLPNVVMLPFTTLQAASGDSELAKLEATCTMHRLFPQKNEKFLRECRKDVLYAFAMNLRSDHDSRARDIAQLMPDARSMEGCWTYADRFGKSVLANELEKLITAVAKEEEDEEESAVRAKSPELFGESSQSTPKPENGPLGKSMQAVKPRHSTQRTSMSLLTTSTNQRTIPTSKFQEEEEEEEEEEILVQYKNAAESSPKALVSVPPSTQQTILGNGKLPRKKGNLPRPVLSDDDSSHSSFDAGEVLPPPPTAHTMVFEEEFSPKNSLVSTNPFKKAKEEPPLLRGISTMEEVTKSHVTASIGGLSTPGNKRKMPAKVNPKTSESGESNLKRRRSKVAREDQVGAKVAKEDQVGAKVAKEDLGQATTDRPKNAAGKASAFSFEKFGWKKVEKEQQVLAGTKSNAMEEETGAGGSPSSPAPLDDQENSEFESIF